MKYQETASGAARTEGATTIAFPFGSPPRLLWYGDYIAIERPERFGAWATPAEQREYVRRFVAGQEVSA